MQSQGHTSRSWDLSMNFMSFKSPQPFVRFSLNITQMFLSMSWCAEPMTQLCKLKVKVTLQGHGILWRGYGCPSDFCLVPIGLNMCLGAQKKHLIVRVLFSTHIMFWLRNKKINFVLITSLSGGLLT